MKKVLLLISLAAAAFCSGAADIVLDGNSGKFTIDGVTGAVKKIVDRRNHTVLTGSQNRYLMQSKAGDAVAFESADKVIKKSQSNGRVTLTCTNSKLPDILITKEYSLYNNGLRRTVTFTNNGKVKRFILPMTDMNFDRKFKENLWHLGAGYIGPYKPLPHVESERPVNEYRQSSKGLVLINPDAKIGNFSHYRVKINDNVVLPWWHSTIGHYREYADRLYYTPQGYRMGLGTLDVLPDGGKISVTDCFNCFDGDMFTFFDDIFMKDSDIVRELASIPAPPAWVKDTYCVGPLSFVDFIRYINEMSSEGAIIPLGTPFTDWADYRSKNGYHGIAGGKITFEELQSFIKEYQVIGKRVKPLPYSIVISTSSFSDIYQEHPEWFRKFDREGNVDSLFPGLHNNYQSMFNYPGLRAYLVDMLMGFVKDYSGSAIYLDEAQMTNTIDHQRNTVTRDDHSVMFWQELKKRASSNDVALFYNGSALPYADFNYMESPHDMRPERWRDYAGIAWGLGLVNRCIPAMRMVPLYWNTSTCYENRVLALGWIPNLGYSASNMQTTRAVWQLGNTYPFNIKYTPDWKHNEQVNVESHAVVRENSRDKLLSFINREKSAKDIPVTVQLDTLGFKADEEINIWRINYNYTPARYNSFVLSDREARNNYQHYGWRDGAVMAKPQLVYSGKASGVFKSSTGKLASNKMCSYLFTAAPAAVYSLNNLPQNSFFTTTRHGKINGKTVELDVRSEILLIARGKDFYDVKVDGAPAEVRATDVSGTAGVLVKVPAGKHDLSWKSRAKAAAPQMAPQAKISINDIVTPDNAAIAVDFNGVTVYAGKTPAALPAQRKMGTYSVRYIGGGKATKLTIYGGKGSQVKNPTFTFSAPQKKVQKVNVRHGNVTVSGKAEFIDRYEDVTGMQRNISPAVATADAEKLTLVSGTTRRDGINLYHNAWAGLELNGARQIKVRLSNTFQNVRSNTLAHVQKGARQEDKNFTGLVVDYQVDGKYVKRVALSAGLYHLKYSRLDPPWGKSNSKVDLNLELGDLINISAEKVFSLDLERYAPKNWNGVCYISLGTARILPNRRLTLQILEFNNKNAKDFLNPVLPQAAGKRVRPQDMVSKVLKNKPASLKKITPAEWSGWSRFAPLQPFGSDVNTILRSRTEGFMAHDFEYIYIGIKAYESRPGISKFAEVYRNERIEFMIVRPDNKLFQVLADTRGRHAIFINGRISELEGVITHSSYQPGMGSNIFIAIPIELLRFDMQRTPVIVKGNLCRVRLTTPVEYSVWAPMEKSFAEKHNYGNLVMHFD